MIKTTCIMCGKPQNNGIMINGKRICNFCENKMIITQMDTDFYRYYIHCIKKNIAEFLLKKEEHRCGNHRY